MSADQITGISLKQFEACAFQKKIILLYPWSSSRNAFLAHFLQTQNANLLYCRLSGTNMPLETWLMNVADEIDRWQQGFSRNLRQALMADSPTQLGEALAADLAECQNGQGLILFIDEFDRAIANKALQTFIKALVAALTADIQIAFSSRCFSLAPWREALTRGEVSVLGTAHRENDGMFTVESQERPQLEVYAFGRGHVLVNGQEIVHWDGALPRNLFFYLMEHPLTTRDEIFEVFWPDLSIKEATNVFHVTKRKIGERISAKVDDHRNYELTQYKTGFYIPSEKIVRHYDVYEFHNAVERAMLAGSDQVEKELLSRGIALYKQPYLTTLSMDWAVQRRLELKHLYAQALIGMARSYKHSGEWQMALGYFTRAIKEVPEREDVHRGIMTIYLQQGMYDDAARQYRSLETIVNKALQVQPDRETQHLFELIQSHR